MNKKITIIDDDPNITNLIELYLTKEGYDVTCFNDSVLGLDSLRNDTPDLVLLDVMMPVQDGYKVLTELRKFSKIPVIMITAKGETFDKVLGLELGADDYVVKPFDPKEIIARIKAVFRRYMPCDIDENKNVVTVPNLVIDMDNYNIKYHGIVMELPPKEIELLFFLVTNPNRVFTRDKLLEKIWGYDYIGESRTVDVHIKRVREKLNKEEEWEIKTVWGVGYKFYIQR